MMTPEEKRKLALQVKNNPQLAMLTMLEHFQKQSETMIDTHTKTMKEEMEAMQRQHEREMAVLLAKVNTNPALDVLASLKVLQGVPGERGVMGLPGITPKRGVDYMTEGDAKWFVGQVLSKIKIPKPKNLTAGIDYPTKTQITQMIRDEFNTLMSLKKEITEEDIVKIIEKTQKVIDVKEMASELARAIEALPEEKKLDYHKGLKNEPGVPVYDTRKTKTIIRGGGGDLVFATDISSQNDGITRTYTVPAHTKAIGLISTQFPIIFRPTVDFTTSGTTLTVDSSLGPIQTGQSLIFQYTQ